jgi:hypothetical protein
LPTQWRWLVSIQRIRLRRVLFAGQLRLTAAPLSTRSEVITLWCPIKVSGNIGARLACPRDGSRVT